MSLSYFTLSSSAMSSPTSGWRTFAERIAPQLTSLSLNTCVAPSLMPSRFAHLRRLHLVDYAWPLTCEKLDKLESLTLEHRGNECLNIEPVTDSWPVLRILVVNGIRVTNTVLRAAPRLEHLECGNHMTEITLEVVLNLALEWVSPPLSSIRIAPKCRVHQDGRWRTATYKTPSGISHRITMSDLGSRIVAFLGAVGKHHNVSCPDITSRVHHKHDTI
jgi:hypothetical protein